MEQDKSLRVYYIVVAAAAISVLIWYFFIYPNRNFPAKPPVLRIAPSQDILNKYSAPSNVVSKKVPDAVVKKYTAPKSRKPVTVPSQSIINSFSASSEI